MLSNQPDIRVFSGICPDGECRTKLFFPSYAASSIECTGCGKHFNKDSLNSVHLIQDAEEALRSLLHSVLLTRTALKKGTDLVKVRGYSNYHCRLLSPIFTYYGVEKVTWKAKLLREMGQGEVFNCFHLGDKAFCIEPEYLETPGYGKDKSGSSSYLQGLLEVIKKVNQNDERLVPLHVDGDGHCLVHAISRALTGREIFWHALMTNLQTHLKDNLDKYRALFLDFIGQDEWDLIISEADPDFEPRDGQPLGLRNIHIFGLANVLHRPILLLDSISGIQSSADYSGTFLPALVPEHLCKSKDGQRIPPLAIVWSSSGRNHYIPLVNIRSKPAAKIPSWVVPKAWGIPNELVRQYINFDSNTTCVIGGNRGMNDAYIQHLMKAMDEKFLAINDVSALLVTEVHQFVFKPSGVVGVKPKTVIERTRQTVEKEMLFRCLSCNAVSEYQCPVNQEWLVPGGHMYNLAAREQGMLSVGEMYSFPESNVVCAYNADKDVLEVVKYKGADISQCILCKGSMRNVKSDGSPVYRNGDRTATPVSGNSRCTCGFKHFWNGKEYDNQPEVLPVSLEWGGKTIKDNVYWFQYEADQSLNSNVYSVAGQLVQKYFPGEFGSERLVQKVVDTILRQTARKEGNNKGARPDIPTLGATSNPEGTATTPSIPSKIILTGQKKKTIHKEELNQSDAERRVKVKTEHHAALTQNRQSRLQKTPEKSPAKTQLSKQEPSPSSPRPTSSPSPRSNKRIRLSSSSGGQRDLTLPLEVTYGQLQEAIEKELGVPPRDQKIRYGFPPQILHPPEEGKEQEPIPIQHGERVMVEILPPPEPEPTPQQNWDIPEEGKMDVAGAVGEEGGVETSTEKKTEESPMDVDVDTAVLASALVSALSSAMPTDMWEMACRSPAMFDKDGYYYNLVFQSLGPLAEDQHCTMPNLPNKVFSYNKEKDRLDLCLGSVHVHVQPINQETLALANAQRTSHQASPVMNTEASFSGAISNRTSGRPMMAFTGEGRSLVATAHVSPRQPEKQLESTSSNQSSVASTSTSTMTETSTMAASSSQATEQEKELSEAIVTDNQDHSIEPPLDQTTPNSTAKSTPDTEMTNEQDVDSNEAIPIAMETTQAGNESSVSPLTSGTADDVMDGSMHAHKSESPAIPEESQNVAGLDSMEVDHGTGIPRDDIPNQATELTNEDDKGPKDLSTGNPCSDSSQEVTGFPRGNSLNESTDLAMGGGSEAKDNSTGNPSSDSSQQVMGFPQDNILNESTDLAMGGGSEAKDNSTGNPSLDSSQEVTGFPQDNILNETTDLAMGGGSEAKDNSTGNPSLDSSQEVTGFPRGNILNESTDLAMGGGSESKDNSTGNPSLDSSQEVTGFPQDNILNESTNLAMGGGSESKDNSTGNPNSCASHEQMKSHEATVGSSSTTGNPIIESCPKDNLVEEKETTDEVIKESEDSVIIKETGQFVAIVTTDPSQ